MLTKKIYVNATLDNLDQNPILFYIKKKPDINKLV